MFWESHPYHWPVVGWPSDIPAISKAQADDFYGTFYAPQNITLILIGDFKPDEAFAMIEKYFGRIPRGPRAAPDVVTLEIPAVAEKRMNAEAEVNPQVDIMWKTVGFGHKDSYPLSILGELLANRTGRLYKGLVLGSKIATQVSAGQEEKKYAGSFSASGEAAEGHTPQEVEDGIYQEIEKLQKEEVPAEELQKVKNNFAAGEYRKLSSNMAILFQLMVSDGMGDWREINEGGPKYQAVTVADVRRVATMYLTKENRTVGTYTRKPGTGGAEDPDLASLNAEQKTAVQQMTARLKTASDPAKLKATLTRMEENAGQVPEEMKPVFAVVKKKVEAKIAELEAAKK